jgi:hypothetical protein
MKNVNMCSKIMLKKFTKKKYHVKEINLEIICVHFNFSSIKFFALIKYIICILEYFSMEARVNMISKNFYKKYEYIIWISEMFGVRISIIIYIYTIQRLYQSS